MAVLLIYKLLLGLWSFQMVTGPLFQIKLHLPSSVLLSGFHTLWNQLSKTVPGKFHGTQAGIVNANVYKTKPIFTALRHSKFSYCSTVMNFKYHGSIKMAAVLQVTFSNAFSSMKISSVWLKFHQNFYKRVNQKKGSINSDVGMVLNSWLPEPMLV